MEILFIDGTPAFTPTRLDEKPAGGIVTSLTLIPRYLAKQGYDVSVCSLYETECEVQGVKYIHGVPESMNPDVVVFNRNLINRKLISRFKDARKVWWLHDIVDHKYLTDDAYRHVDDIVALSKYCMDSYSDYYGIPKTDFTIIPNGIDPQIFYPSDEPKNPNLYICASAPVKGLYPLEFTYYNLKRNNPDIELRLYSSQSLHDLENSRNIDLQLDNLRAAGVKVLPPIPQKELADVMRQAWCLLMPNHYPEICSNLLLQAQACKLPVISVPIGSATEYIKHNTNGLLTHTYPHDMYWWWKDFAEQAVKIQDRGLHDKLVKSQSTPWTWGAVGYTWQLFLQRAYGNISLHEASSAR